MAAFFSTFHIEGKLLLAQAVNFGVVFALIYFLIIKQLMKLMKSRTETIEKGLEDAKKAESSLLMAGHEKERIISEGHQEAKSIVLGAQSTGEALIEEARVAAEAVSQKEKAAAIKELDALREHQAREIKEKSVELVISGVEKILKEEVDAKKAEAIIKQLIA
jgi:ATP synthase F0 subunit b